ncbi:MAG TPA: response regulator [Gemmataceae bacterium]|jgi:CheY-like chemotaxis protein
MSLSFEPVPPQRILVVDGYVEAAKEMAGQLRKMGHTVEFALDGQTALRIEPTFKPDIVIIKLDLPGMDAITVARSLRAQANRDLILVGDRGSDEDYARANQAGCFNSYMHWLKSMPFIQYGSEMRKLANQSPEDWVRFELLTYPKEDKGDFVNGVLTEGTERFDPAELAPLIPDELLREIRRLVESPADLARLPVRIPYDREDMLKAASRWFRFFNP